MVNYWTFDIDLIPYTGDDSWVPDTLNCKIPKSNPDCDYCNYRQAASTVEKIPPHKKSGALQKTKPYTHNQSII